MLNEKIIDRNYRQNTHSICGFSSKTERLYKKQTCTRIPPFLSSHNVKACNLGTSLFTDTGNKT